MNPAAALAIIALNVLIAGGALGALVMVIQWSRAERQVWAEERRMLVDRVIANHAGEVVALDRAAAHVPREREPRPPIEGLS